MLSDADTHAIAVACLDGGLRARADALARELGVACVDAPPDGWRALTDWPFLLLLSAEGLALGQTGGERVTPVRVEDRKSVV